MFRLIACLVFIVGFSLPVRAAEYAPVSLQNNSNALFKIGMLRPSDPLAVDEYLRIHHCGLYEQYGGDDVAWSRLRDAQAREITLALPGYNENLEVEGTISLGNYDVTTGRFAIGKKDVFNNTATVNLNAAIGGWYEPCSGRGARTFVPRAHPLRLSARLSQTFSMADIPVNRPVAEDMIKIINGRKAENDTQRLALVVMHLRLKGPDPLSGATEPSTMTVTADLDEVLVYDGPDRKLLLYKKSFKGNPDAKSGSR